MERKHKPDIYIRKSTLNHAHDVERNEAFQINNSLRHHKSAATFFLAAIYIPYMVMLGISYDVFDLSLSRIGWQHGGFAFLLAYVMLTIPFILYQILVNMKYRNERNRAVCVITVLGLVLLAAGALVPFRTTDSDFVLNLHRFCGVAGSILLISIITYLLIRYFMSYKHKQRKVVAVAVAYGIFLVSFIALYFVMGANAIFEVGSSFGFLIVLQLINRVLPEKSLLPVADTYKQQRPQQMPMPV